MMERDICLTLGGIVGGGVVSWLITYCYYIKAMKSQETESSKQIKAMEEALKEQNINQNIFQTQEYIEKTIQEWTHSGEPYTYLDSLTSLQDDQKSEILIAASLRKKGRHPKKNPYHKG